MGMKIGTIADLHIDRHNKKTSEDYLEALVEIVKYRNWISVRLREISQIIIN